MTLLDRDEDVDALRRRIAKLERINDALMDHVERATDRQANAYSLFQTAITLDARVRSRTEELTALMRSLESSNQALVGAKEEAELANRSKTRFLAAASHDLLQPLNAARLSLSTLVDMPIGDDALGVAHQVERGLRTIEDLIKTLIDISKLDAGVVRPNVRSIDLNEILAEIEASFGPAAARKGLRFSFCAPPLAVESDPVLLKRTLQNLVSNALRYTRGGGVRVRARPKAGMCFIDVVDTGPGISPADRERIFDEFYRCDHSIQDQEIGLGLGLSIVKRMTLALGHGLQVVTKLGLGSRFRLRLAMAQTPARREPSPSAYEDAVSTLSGAGIVVVENDAAAAEALSRLLKSWKAVVTCGRGLAEVQMALPGDRRPDILLIDYHLDHGACGIDVVRALRDRFGDGLPAIITTADHSAEVAEHVRGAGCELIHKPIKPAHARALISHLLRRHPSEE